MDEKKIAELATSKDAQEAFFGKNGLIKELIKSTLETALKAEMAHHLEETAESSPQNKRNGKSKKTVKSGSGEFEIEIPRDREGEFEPQLVKKHQRRLAGLDQKILSLYARGLSTRDIQAEIQDMYGVELSPTLISQVTDNVMDEVKAWQNRPLDPLYPIVFLDALVVKVKENKQIMNKAVYLALGINQDGLKEVLGMWVSPNEGAKFWLSVLTELQNRGMKDVFIFCTDGLTGFPEAIEAVYPNSKIQLCIVHMIRNSTKFVNWKDRKPLCADLKQVYQASTIDQAETALLEFGEKWDKKYPNISQMWQRHWEHITTFFAYPEDIRRVIYTTNAIESLNMTVRKVIKNKRSFPSDEAMFKQIYLALNNIGKKWTMSIRHWGQAMNRFAIEFVDRL
ncbi:MAG: IS256 family transposase [Gammaproteobacteria bacterium]